MFGSIPKYLTKGIRMSDHIDCEPSLFFVLNLLGIEMKQPINFLCGERV